MPDVSQRGRAIQKAIGDGTEDLRNQVDSAVEWSSVTVGEVDADGRPTADTSDGEDVQVLEPYGFAGVPPGSATTLVLSPGGDSTDRVALGLSSGAGRPATAAGDTAMWTASGHKIELDDDGGIIVTSKDGAVIELDDTGAITVDAGTGASITINVDGGQSVNIGGGSASSLLKAASTETFMAAAAAFAGGASVLGDGGAASWAAFAQFMTGTLPAPPPGLASSSETTKAMGE